MDNKIWQFADGIHGTIYVSELERKMMATPFFYRLHDVYQSSTVYMTFPSNRTKRYEHSLGTMELAGRMFFSAVNNASTGDKYRLLQELEKQFNVILEGLTANRTKLCNYKLYFACEGELSVLFPREYSLSSAYDDVEEEMQSVFDFSLNRQAVCFLDILSNDNRKEFSRESSLIGKARLYSFLYQCTLEALRIAALFHDIGHPPFSHIIEHILSKLYYKYSNAKKDYSQNRKVTEFIECLSKYNDMNERIVEPLLLDSQFDCKAKEDPALHEKIGLNILYNTYKSTFEEAVKSLAKISENEPRSASLRALYLITVLEFTFGILLEKTSVFQSIHSLIDGVVDADRMDYVMRDAHNAGVDWGEIPYSRLISAAKFVYDSENDDKLKLAFPEKVCDDIDDLLESRYKIFQRINYHHKSVKTSELLQRSVEMLARDYLESAEPIDFNGRNYADAHLSDDAIAPDIRYLWENLNVPLGTTEKENQISQWTDSWLISVLSKASNEVNTPRNIAKHQRKRPGRSQEELKLLKNTLEEVQLNRKHYYPLLKRQRDALALMETVVKYAKLDEETLDNFKEKEYNKLMNETGKGAAEAKDSLLRIFGLERELIGIANLGIMDVFSHGEKTCKEIIEEQLNEFHEKGIIRDFFLWENAGSEKFGISGEVTLYHRNGKPYVYNIETALKKKLNAQRAGCLWMFVYVSFGEGINTDQDRVEKREEILNCIGKAIGTQINETLSELCSYPKASS